MKKIKIIIGLAAMFFLSEASAAIYVKKCVTYSTGRSGDMTQQARVCEYVLVDDYGGSGGNTGGDTSDGGGGSSSGGEGRIDEVEACELAALDKKNRCINAETAGYTVTALACFGLGPGTPPMAVCEIFVLGVLGFKIRACESDYEYNKAMCD